MRASENLSQIRRRSLRRLSCERGLTLIELLVAALLGLVIAGASMSLMIITLKQENVVSSRAYATRAAEVMLQRLTRELRQAQYILSTTTGSDTTPVNVTYSGGVSSMTSSVSFYLPNAGSTSAGTQVTWTCTAGASCTRTAGSTTVTELSGVLSAAFTPISSSTGNTLVSGAGSLSTPSYPSSVNFTLQVNVTSQLDPGRTHIVTGLSHPIIVQDGVSLRSYAS